MRTLPHIQRTENKKAKDFSQTLLTIQQEKLPQRL